jgi:hypothetical protein
LIKDAKLCLFFPMQWSNEKEGKKQKCVRRSCQPFVGDAKRRDDALPVPGIFVTFVPAKEDPRNLQRSLL